MVCWCSSISAACAKVRARSRQSRSRTFFLCCCLLALRSDARRGYRSIGVRFAVYGVLVFINIRGVREGAGAVTAITVAKLLPLLLFIGVGIFFIHPPNLTFTGWPGSKPLGDAVILLIFAFVGIEVALIPSGEVRNPARTVPRS